MNKNDRKNSASKAPDPIHQRASASAQRHGFSVSFLWNAVANGKFSAPRKLGPRISLFHTETLDREVEAFLSRRPSRDER